jgi:hypothetical protein
LGHRRSALPHASRPADRLNRAQTTFFTDDDLRG